MVNVAYLLPNTFSIFRMIRSAHCTAAATMVDHFLRC